MEKIGDFAKRCDVTIKTLRYYDTLGLLKPDYIDPFTNYRYYDSSKVGEMNRINELKENGFTLEEIKQFCFAADNEGKLQVIWKKRQALEKLTSEIARQLLGLAKIENEFILNKEKNMNETINFNNTFENDERVIGRWEIIASVNNKEDFVPIQKIKNESPFEEIYFLPNGEEYWGFSWTKGYLKITFGNGLLCPYELEEIDGNIYMFAHTDYREKIWVLKQADNKKHTKYGIGQQDDIALPFVNDEEVIGTWKAVDFVENIENFDMVNKSYKGGLYYVMTEFLPNGILYCHFDYDNKGNKPFIEEKKWTKGTTMWTWTNNGDGTTTAPAYEIRNFNGEDFLFIEWKSGDYIWGKRKPQYYVFRRVK